MTKVPSKHLSFPKRIIVRKRMRYSRNDNGRAAHIPGLNDDSKALQTESWYDVVILRLFCTWMFLQCFFYGALPFLRWDLGVNVTPDKVVLIAMLGAVAARMARAGPSPKSSTRAAVALGPMSLVFTIVALTSWFMNGADAHGENFGQLTRAINLSLYPALAYFVARHIQYTRAMLQELLWILAVVGVYLSVTAIAEHYSLASLVFPRYILDPTIGIHVGRSRGPFVNTIGNGAMLLLSFLACGWLSASLTGFRRFVTLFFALLIVPAVYFTETRSVWLALATITATLLMLQTPLRRTGAVIISVLVVTFLIGIGSKFSAFDQTLFSRRQRTVDYRLDNYQIAWNAFTVNPIFGLGYGKLQTEWANYSDLRNSRLGVGLDDGNHNTLLGILADLGLAGAIPFIGMVACAVIVCFKAYRDLGHPDAILERQFAVVTIGALQVFLILGLTSDLKTVPTVNTSAFWFVGIITSIGASGRTSAAAGSVRRPEVLISPRRSSRLRRLRSASRRIAFTLNR